jgi:hypothetical protein
LQITAGSSAWERQAEGTAGRVRAQQEVALEFLLKTRWPRLRSRLQSPATYNKMASRAAPQTTGPTRTVALGGGASAAVCVWVMELRVLNGPPTLPPQLHAALDRRVRTMRSVAEWQMTTWIHPTRQEVVVQLVLRRRTAAHRGDNLFLGWSRIVARVFNLDDTLPRRVWEESPTKSGGTVSIYCDVRSSSEPFSEACRRVSLAAGDAKVRLHSTDALPLLPALRKPAAA